MHFVDFCCLMIALMCVYMTRGNKDLHWVGHLSLMVIVTGGQGRNWNDGDVWYLDKNRMQ